MARMTMFAVALATAVASVALPSAASAQTYFSFSVGNGYRGYRPPAYAPPGYYYDEDARAAWIARQRWEERRRCEERERWEREEARRRYWQHEYWEHHRWHHDDDEDDDD